MRLLLVEDDKKAARVLARGLVEEGFVVDVAHSGEVGDELAASNRYDAIVLDWLLPRKDGLAVCRGLRRRGIRTPILMLTARDSLPDRVSGLDSGADDYLTKPFAFEELLARIRALLRRSELTRPPVLKVADLALDPVTHRVAAVGPALLVALLPTGVFAQTPQRPPTFQAGIEIIRLSLSVTDGHNHLITGLSKSDFAVFEDGVRQDLSFFTRDPLPLSVALLIDCSASMDDKLPVAQEAGVRFHLGAR